MSRTPGSRDLKKRKTRSDKKHKHRRNRAGNLVPYISKRKKGDPLKVWFWHIKPMSIDGYKNWNPNLRPRLHRIIYKFVGRPVSVDPSYLSNKAALEELAVNVVGYPGNFLLMMPCHSKNTFRVSYKKRAKIQITETEDGLRAKVLELHNIQRYWFWKDK